jgi:HemY protein
VIIRLIIILALAAFLALGAAWVADRPGEISVTWLGWHIETSILVAAVALLIAVALLMFLLSVVRTILRSPDLMARMIRVRRSARGDRAITRGLIAVGAGDLRMARKYSSEAERLKSGEPLSLLLNAQTAQLSGDRTAAELAFRAMAGREDTKLLGLRGLFIEARRREDLPAARNYAEEAARSAPALAWAGQAALEFRSSSGDWDGAIAVLERNMKNKLIDKPAYKRQRAVLLTASALAAEETDRDHARSLVLDAIKLAPTLVPAAELAGRLLAEARKLRKAGKIIEKAWTANPHPDLAQVFAYLRFGDTARDRLARVQSLAEKAPGHAESAIAVARAAIDAQEFAVARNALKPLLAEPTQRVAELMAELEHADTGNDGRAREWMARALRAPHDAAWTADGFVSDRWLPVSPVTGRLDALQWKVPLAAIGRHEDGALIDDDARAPLVEAQPSQPIAPVSANDDQPAPSSAAGAANPTVRRSASLSLAQPKAEPRNEPKSEPRVEPVIPLVHAPDDPGPESPAEPESAPEVPADTWWRIRLFK